MTIFSWFCPTPPAPDSLPLQMRDIDQGLKLDEQIDGEEVIDSGPFFNTLPDELLLRIFQGLGQADQGRAAASCRRFSSLNKDRTLWDARYSAWLEGRQLIAAQIVVRDDYSYLALGFHENLACTAALEAGRDWLGTVATYSSFLRELHCLDLSVLKGIPDQEIRPFLAVLIAKTESLELVNFAFLNWEKSTWSIVLAALLRKNPLLHTLDLRQSNVEPVHVDHLLALKDWPSLRKVLLAGCASFRGRWGISIDNKSPA